MHAAYTMPDETGSFGGARYLFVVTRFDHRKAQCYLQTQEAYTLHKHMRRCFLHRKMLSKLVDSKGIADLCQADLIDRSGIANYNDSYRYLLTCIDVFTKGSWVIPLHSKTAKK